MAETTTPVYGSNVESYNFRAALAASKARTSARRKKRTTKGPSGETLRPWPWAEPVEEEA